VKLYWTAFQGCSTSSGALLGQGVRQPTDGSLRASGRSPDRRGGHQPGFCPAHSPRFEAGHEADRSDPGVALKAGFAVWSYSHK